MATQGNKLGNFKSFEAVEKPKIDAMFEVNKKGKKKREKKKRWKLFR